MLFFIGLLLRVVSIFVLKNYTSPRDYEYGEIARNIIIGKGFARATDHGGGVVQTSSHAPLYPYFLALFYKSGLSPKTFIMILLIQAIFSALTILVFYKISLTIFNTLIANLTAIGITFYPPFLYYTTKLVPTTLFLFLLSLTALLILMIKKDDIRSNIVPGIVFGITLLCDPITFVMYPALLLWHFVKKEFTIKNFVVIILFSIMVLLPWTVRNYKIHNQIVLVTTQFGVNFWIGNNQNATGTDYYRVYSIDDENFVLMTQTITREVREKLDKMSEIERAKIFMNEGLKFIRNNPIKFSELLVKKFYYYWWFTPQEINGSIDATRYRNSYIIFYLPVLILGILGILMSLSYNYIKIASLIIFVIISISAIYIVTHVGLIRYRLPIEGFLLMFSAFSIVSFFTFKSQM